jgi:hypothetical protein
MSTIETSLRIPDDFNQWLKQSRRSWAIPSVGVVISPILAILINLRWPSSLLSSDFLPVMLLGFQAVVITVFLLLIPDPLSNVEFAKHPSIAIEQFHQAWKRLWFFWILLYIGLAAQELLVISLKKEQVFLNSSWRWSISLIITNLLNNLQTLTLAMCYLVVSSKTVESKRATNPLPWLQGAGVLITITAVEIFLTILVSTIWKAEPATVPKVFIWFNGLGAGVVLALLIGRLESKLIDLPVWIVVSIYLYAVIQSGWAAFPEKPNVKMFLLIAALVLKISLFLLVFWLLKSGVLLYYLERIKKLDDENKAQRYKFLCKLQSST